MNMLFYAAEVTDDTQRLEELIQTTLDMENIEVFRNIEAFMSGLKRPRLYPALALIATASRSELLDITRLEPLLDDVKIVLILPDCEDETLALGHRLRPRYMSFAGDRMEDVAAILKKMMDTYRAGSPGYGITEASA
ncbi:MAG: hypothetical protein KKB20_26490 [Proteobacteria bacterium]|nr:hypothetical protein [Pseudomonadota bacterium]